VNASTDAAWLTKVCTKAIAGALRGWLRRPPAERAARGTFPGVSLLHQAIR